MKGLIFPGAPTTENVPMGVEVFIPTMEFAPTNKIELPVEEVTLKGLRLDVPFTLNDTVEDVALTPETVPLSINVP